MAFTQLVGKQLHRLIEFKPFRCTPATGVKLHMTTRELQRGIDIAKSETLWHEQIQTCNAQGIVLCIHDQRGWLPQDLDRSFRCDAHLLCVLPSERLGSFSPL